MIGDGADPPAGRRGADQLRETRFEIGAAPFAEGSCLIATGSTRILCTATVTGG